MEWYLKVVRDNYNNFSGRATRQEYWMFFLFNMIFGIILFVFDTSMILYFIYIFGVLIPGLAVATRRLHDIGKSGWWIFINFVPIIGGIWFFILMCTDTKPDLNQYGESPKYGSLMDLVDEMIDDEREPEEHAEEPIVEKQNNNIPGQLIPISLNVDNGARKGSFYAVSSNSRIGRAPDNDIVLNADTISSYHAEIIIRDNTFYIKDMNSTNGTKVNGKRVSEAGLSPGLKLQIGETELTVN